MRRTDSEKSGLVQRILNPFSGKNYTVNEVGEMARYAPEDLAKHSSQFVKDVLVPEALKGIPEPTNNVAATHANNKEAIPGAEDVTSFNASNQSAVATQQGSAGVDPNKGPADTVSKYATQMLGSATEQINLGNSGIKAEGQPMKDSVIANTDPTRQNNIWLAAQNAAASVLPDGTMKLIDGTVGLSNDAGVAKPAADNYKGTMTDAVVDTAIFGASMLVGGPVGGKVVNTAFGKAAESLAVKAGKVAGDAAEETAKAVAGAAEHRLASGAAKAEGAGAPEAAEAARKAAEHTATNAGVTAANAGAKAEVNAAQTVTGMSKIAGVGAGGATANQLTGQDGFVETVKETDRAVMKVVDDAIGQNESPSSSRVSSGQIKYPSAEPADQPVASAQASATPASSADSKRGDAATAPEEATERAAANPSAHGQTPTSK